MLPNRKVSEVATGRWPSILMHFGIAENFLNGKHGPCPICGGKDRFRFDDKLGRGTWICSQSCGAGDGFKLLQLVKGWSFKEAAYQVEQIVGGITQVAIKQESDASKKVSAVRRIWNESLSITKGDPAWAYLNRRVGIEIFPSCLRYHPALPYVDGDSIEYHPALVAALTNAEGKGVGVHRIYLDSDGNKARVESQKKLMVCGATDGASVKLGAPAECIGIAEGIETALAASRRFSMPVWSAISAVGLEKWSPPSGVDRVVVFGDNDSSYTGQASSYVLAKRLHSKGISVEVRLPSVAGKDWADEV